MVLLRISFEMRYIICVYTVDIKMLGCIKTSLLKYFAGNKLKKATDGKKFFFGCCRQVWCSPKRSIGLICRKMNACSAGSLKRVMCFWDKFDFFGICIRKAFFYSDKKDF